MKEKIKELEDEKAVMDEKIENCGRALPSFTDQDGNDVQARVWL